MRPDGIYVTESEGGVGVASHWPWSNKGQGEKNCWMRDGAQPFSAGGRVVAPASDPVLLLGSKSGRRIFPPQEVLTSNT